MFVRSGRSLWRSLACQPTLYQRNFSFFNVRAAIKHFLFGKNRLATDLADRVIDAQTLKQVLHKHEPSVLSSERRNHHHVQEETINVITNEERLQALRKQSFHNLTVWSQNGKPSPFCVEVIKADWGVVAQEMTKKYGKIYAILNMANPYFVGGGFLDGGSAQEENMFARTSCAQGIVTQGVADISLNTDFIFRYKQVMSNLINAKTPMTAFELQKLSTIYGKEITTAYKVYINTTNPEVCFRGAELFVKTPNFSFFDDKSTSEYAVLHPQDGSFSYLKTDQIFPFYELRSAALDLNDSSLKVDWNDEKFLTWFRKETKRRIDAQLDTALLHNIRHIELSAFGCGSFQNKAAEVAKLYRQAIEERAAYFEHVVFAIYYPEFGTNNFFDFAEELKNITLGRNSRPIACR